MEYNYNNTMTISTSGPKNEMNARWALQNTLEGKALVYNECIKPLVVAFQHPAVRAVALTAVIVHHVSFQAHQAVVCAFAGLACVAVPDKALCQSIIQDVIDQRV